MEITPPKQGNEDISMSTPPPPYSEMETPEREVYPPHVFTPIMALAPPPAPEATSSNLQVALFSAGAEEADTPEGQAPPNSLGQLILGRPIDGYEGAHPLVQYNQQLIIQQDPHLHSLLSQLGEMVPRIAPPGAGEQEMQKVSAQLQQNAMAIQNLENASSFQMHKTLQALQVAENVTSSQSAQLQHTFEALHHLENANEFQQMRHENIFAEIKFNLDELKNDITFLQGGI